MRRESWDESIPEPADACGGTGRNELSRLLWTPVNTRQWLLLAWLSIGTGGWLSAGEPHTWTDRQGNEVEARVRAMDAHRLILGMEDGTALVVPREALTPPDQEYATAWRRRHPDAPLADPQFPYPWPDEAGAVGIQVQKHPDDEPGGAHHYQSDHYAVRSGLDLPVSQVREILAVFEATRAAVMASPLGLLEGTQDKRHPVFLFRDPARYAAAGGPPGSGGSYHGYTGRMLVLLPNLGIDPASPSAGFTHRERLYVLKHEAVHQLLPPWAWRMPYWLNEGLCEVFASMPYSHDRYRFRDFDHAMFQYLRKWDKNGPRPPLRLLRPELLMEMSQEEWSGRVASLSAYDLYNSAGLLTHWFLHHDTPGNGVGLIGFLAAIREGLPIQEALDTHLLRGRSSEEIERAIEELARRHGTQIEWIGGWPATGTP